MREKAPRVQNQGAQQQKQRETEAGARPEAEALAGAEPGKLLTVGRLPRKEALPARFLGEQPLSEPASRGPSPQRVAAHRSERRAHKLKIQMSSFLVAKSKKT